MVYAKNWDWIMTTKDICLEILKENWFIEAPTEEVKGDWIELLYKDLAEIQAVKTSLDMFRWKVNTYLPKPVEQELIPLLPRDIVAITDEIICLDELGKVDEDRIHKILSKYWVHKQEEKWASKEDIAKIVSDIAGIKKDATPTPQATSVIDIKKDFEANMLDWDDIDDCWGAMLSAKSVLEYLSSLPIVQKKRTRLEIWEYFGIKWDDKIDTIDQTTRDKNLWVYSFLKDNWLLSD